MPATTTGGETPPAPPTPLAPPAPPAPPVSPVATRRPTVLENHGNQRIDSWFWLRDRGDPAVLDHLRAENTYTERATARLEDRRGELFEEIRSRIEETDLSVPVRWGSWWYFSRTVEGRDYVMHCRLPDGEHGRTPGAPPLDRDGNLATPWPDEQVLLDENDLAEPGGYLHVANLAVSPGHHRLAYGLDITGAERYTLRIRDLVSGEDLPERIENTSYGLAWANDEGTVFYTRPDDANRSYQLWRHRVGSDPTADELVHQEDDERFHLGVGRTKDDRYVLLDLRSKLSAEIWALDADDPDGRFSLVEPRRDGVEYDLEHHQGTFLMLTNDAAENFRLMVAPAQASRGGATRHWREALPHRTDVRLEGFDIFAEHLVTYERADGLRRIQVYALDDEPWAAPLRDGWVVPTPETPSAAWGGPNPEFGAGALRYEYSSLVTPRSVYDLDLRSRQPVLRKRQAVLGGYDQDRFVTDRLWAEADDGTSVPISVVRAKDTALDGSAPCLLYGYGSYEYSVDPTFSSVRLCLLERGFVYAIAHVRGGGELGRRWYEEGKLLAKANTFSDFVACARALVQRGWTRPDRLLARGASAGGLLIGAVANRAPELFRAMVAEVPFVDCLTTMLDDTLPLTVTEWEEWGDPLTDPAVYQAMLAYSPYDNVSAQHYPDMLVTAGLEDPRVGYWEPAKWVQKLRVADPKAMILLKVELGAGHGGPSGRYDAWRDEAFVLSFLLDAVGR
jgi:oligopeptidase B